MSLYLGLRKLTYTSFDMKLIQDKETRKRKYAIHLRKQIRRLQIIAAIVSLNVRALDL